jgi:hypothetical protein
MVRYLQISMHSALRRCCLARAFNTPSGNCLSVPLRIGSRQSNCHTLQ